MNQSGMQTYLVGGAIRDRLLGLPVGEKDWVVVGATPESMVEQGFKPVGKDFPVFLHPQTSEEYALARTERKTAPGYHGFVFHTGDDVTLEDDLLRRDLTINAIAESQDGELIDPYGGAKDIEARVLRHVSPAFTEDPVRILRVARFYARFRPLGFQVAKETRALMKQMVAAGEVDHLQPERVWQELRRALNQDDPAAFIELLREVGALARIIPELDALFGVPQTKKYHPEIDCGIHTLMVLQQAVKKQADEVVRFACLCHDFGKGVTPGHVLPGHRGHEEAGLPLVEDFCDRLRVPKRHRELALTVTRQHLKVHKCRELRPKTLLALLESLNGFRDELRFEQALLACECDATGRGGKQDEPYPQADYMRQALLAASTVQAVDVMVEGVQGADIGAHLRQARIKVLKAFKKNPL